MLASPCINVCEMEQPSGLCRGCLRTLDEIAQLTGDPPASVSAQLRHLRKEKYGAHCVEKRRREGGLWEYSLKGMSS